MPEIFEVVGVVNATIALRRRVERAARHGLDPGDPGYASAASLEEAAKTVNTVLTAYQRVDLRFGGHKQPDDHAVLVDLAKSLRGINATMIGIYDVMRYTVVTPILATRFLYATHVLSMFSRPVSRRSTAHHQGLHHHHLRQEMTMTMTMRKKRKKKLKTWRWLVSCVALWLCFLCIGASAHTVFGSVAVAVSSDTKIFVCAYLLSCLLAL